MPVYLSRKSIQDSASRRAQQISDSMLADLDDSIAESKAQISQATAPVQFEQPQSQEQAPAFELPSVGTLMEEQGFGSSDERGSLAGSETALSGSGSGGGILSQPSGAAGDYPSGLSPSIAQDAGLPNGNTGDVATGLAGFQLPTTEELTPPDLYPRPVQTDEGYGSALTTLGGTPEAEQLTRPGGSASTAPDDIAGYIRHAAQQRGIDPEIALRVAMSEGGVSDPVRQSDYVNPKTGKREESYGPFQLYMGGGLGNKFQATTGKAPSDPSAWRQAVDFALDEAARGGWGPWYGAARVGIGNRQGLENARAIGISAEAGPGGGANTGAFDPDAIARKWAGKQYAFGGRGGRGGGLTDTDCSGFVAEETGLPAHTDAAYNELTRRGAAKIDMGQARPGDIVFYMGGGTGGQFTHHMGLYAGPGKVLDMSSGGVKVRDIGHAGKFEILRDPTDTSTPDVPRNAQAPTPIVETGVAEATQGQKIKGMNAQEALRRYPNMAQLDLSGMPEDGNAQDSRFGNEAAVSEAPMNGQLSPTSPPARDDWRSGATSRDSDAGSVGGLPYGNAGQFGATRLDTQPASDQGLSAEPSVGLPSRATTNLPNPPARDDYRLDRASSPPPGGAVEPLTVPPEAPASSGNPIEELGQTIGTAISNALRSVFAPQRPDYSQPAQDIQQRQATMEDPGGPMPLQPVRDVVTASQRDMETFRTLNGRQLMGETLTPEEEAEMARAAINVVGDVSGAGAMGLRGGAPREAIEKAVEIGAPNAQRALDTLDTATRGIRGVAEPSMGIVSRAKADEAGQLSTRADEALAREADALTTTPPQTGDPIPRDTMGRPTELVAPVGRAVGAGIGTAYQESQNPESTPQSILQAGTEGAATSLAGSTLGRALRPGRRPPVDVARRVVAQSDADDTRRTTAFSPTDPNITYDLEHKVVDLADLITSHGDDFRPNPRFPQELQPRLRDRAAAASQVQRIANELNPDALLYDTRSIQSGSPIVGPDNIVESGNGRVMALRNALKRNPEAAARYRDEVQAAADAYGIPASELRGKQYPVLVRERLSDVDRQAFAREANESATAVVSGFEQALGDARRLTDDMIAGLSVNEGQSIDQALGSSGNRELARAFTGSLPRNEAGTMVDDAGNLSQEGVARLKKALVVKAYGSSTVGQRMARSLIESIDPGVKNVETAIYGSLPSIARVESIAKRGDLSISEDIAKAADMYARLKSGGISVADYMAQGSMWERETTPIQDRLMQAFEAHKRSARRIRDVLEGYASRAEPQADPSQGDMFGGMLARATKEDILDSAIRDIGGLPEEAASTGGATFREGLDGGQSRQRVEPVGESSRVSTTTILDEGSGQPPARVATGAAAPEPPAGPAPGSGLYVGEARRRTQKRIADALAKGEPITLSTDDEIKRLRLDKILPEELWDDAINAAKNENWFRDQRRGRIPDVEVQAVAGKQWASIDDIIKRGAAGKAYNPEETVAMRNLLKGQFEIVADYTRQLAEPLTKTQRDRLLAEQLAESQKLTALFQVAEGARAEAGRTLRQYRQFAQSLKDNPTEAGIRFIQQRYGSLDKAEDAVAKYSQLVQDGADPVELAAFLRSVRPGWMDRLNILRYGSMLSATSTHLAQAMGNTAQLGLDVGLKPLAVGIDAARAGVTGGQRTRYMGEVGEQSRGMLEGSLVGLRDMWTVLRTGVNPNDVSQIDNIRSGFGVNPVVDTVMESPLRLLTAGDVFFRGMSMGGHARALAYRKASQEGLTGAAKQQRVQDIVANIHKNLDVLDGASKQADRALLQEDRRAVQAGFRLREGLNGLVPYLGDVIVPFVRTPVNIVAQGIEMSPLGVASVVKDARAGKVGDATDTAARAMFGTALMATAGTLAMNGMMTGAYPDDQKTRSTLPPGWQPYSLKLGDKYYAYSNLGPIGVPVAAAVIMAEAHKQGKPIASGETVMKLGKFMGDQTFMRGVSDFVKAFNDPSRYGENVVENIGTQFAPHAALGRQVQRAMGMAAKDPHGAMEALMATYPMTAGGVPDRIDSRGQAVMPGATGAEAVLSPVRTSREQPDRVLDVLRKSGVGIGGPPKTLITSDGRNVTLTPRQQQQFQQMLYSEIQQNLIDFNDPATAERAMGQARARARESLLLGVR